MKTIKNNKFCQSCGMPIQKDPEKGGTNVGGTKNKNYCSYCYQDGDFLFNGTVKEMQAFCKDKMVENGSSKFIAWLFTRVIPRLERWKK
ncbi:zinc ribbon domain-containing protein [Pontimicrobium sp. SW4]|uniref:Zinc ribbon domain-containing protein n=1 Tax=Pontimicrobium sp. SW4 TaxID=3153519 RepID=A0AAU7BVT0_9FLAO